MIRSRLLVLVMLVAGAMALTGCLTARQQAQMAAPPTNRVFQPESVAALPPDRDHYFGEFDRSGTQSICLLMLTPDAALTTRYHADHDLTLFVVSGSAIVQVEETRYFVGPGSAVLLPRLTAYSIVPKEMENAAAKGLTALMVFSPPFNEKDTKLEE